jgi:hypothetical protein
MGNSAFATYLSPSARKRKRTIAPALRPRSCFAIAGRVETSNPAMAAGAAEQARSSRKRGVAPNADFWIPHAARHTQQLGCTRGSICKSAQYRVRGEGTGNSRDGSENPLATARRCGHLRRLFKHATIACARVACGQRRRPCQRSGGRRSGGEYGASQPHACGDDVWAATKVSGVAGKKLGAETIGRIDDEIGLCKQRERILARKSRAYRAQSRIRQARQPMYKRFRLACANVVLMKHNLAMQVGKVDYVIVHDGERSYARMGQDLSHRATETAGTNEQYTGSR